MQLDLKPVSYSKAKSVAMIAEKLRQAPEQIPGGKEAFEGKVMEFVLLHGDRRVGTLTEYATEFPDQTEFVIHLANETITIEKQGIRFFPKETSKNGD